MTNYPLINSAKALQDAGNALIDRMNADFDHLSFHQIYDISNKAQELFLKSNALLEQAVILIADDAKDALSHVEDASDEIAKAIKTIGNVQSAITIGTDLVTLAGSILSGNVPGIVDSAGKILGELT
jgi:hypothetical protein